MHTVELVLLLLMLGAASGLAARYVPAVPLPLVQIALGALLSLPREGLHVALDPQLFLFLFIPPLLFADGWRTPKREFFALRGPILTLALGLVLFTVVGAGYFAHWLMPQLPLPAAFALAAVLSPTDAVAVSAITRRLGMPRRMMQVLQGESLLNDASGLVALKFAVAATLTGAFSWTQAGRSFAWMALGGVAVGMAVGWGFALLRGAVTRRLGDAAATQTVLLLLLLPFAAYMLGERLGASGILAAVAAGMTTNFADLDRGEFIAERIQAQGAWAMVEAAFNGAIFLLLGLQLPGVLANGLQRAGLPWWQLAAYVLALTAALVVLRAVWVMLAVRRAMLRMRRRGGSVQLTPSARLMAINALAGVRGAVTLAAALSVPLAMPDGSPFPGRDLLIFLATGVILATLVVASVGLPLLLRGLPPEPAAPHEREERLARIAGCEAAIRGAAQWPPDMDIPADDPLWQALVEQAQGEIAAEYRRRIETLELPGAAASDAAGREARRQAHALELSLRLAALRAERESFYELRRTHAINDDSLRTLVSEVDLLEVSLRKRLAAARKAIGRGGHEAGAAGGAGQP